MPFEFEHQKPQEIKKGFNRVEKKLVTDPERERRNSLPVSWKSSDDAGLSTQEKIHDSFLSGIKKVNQELGEKLQGKWEARQRLETTGNDIGREIEAAESTLKSWRNKPNEDKSFVDAENRSAGVFDGMGGTQNGGKAAEIARDTTRKILNEISDDLSVEETEEKVREAIVEALGEIKRQGTDGWRVMTMGTTATITKIMKDGTIIIGNAGDSRAYLFNQREQSLKHLTLDDVPGSKLNPNENRRKWEIQETVDDLESFSNVQEKDVKKAIDGRNDVFNGLNFNGFSEDHPDTSKVDPAIYRYKFTASNKNDKLLLVLVTDGVPGNLTRQETIDFLSKTSFNVQEAAQTLVKEAQQVGLLYKKDKNDPRKRKNDDMTAVVIDITQIAQERMQGE